MTQFAALACEKVEISAEDYAKSRDTYESNL